MDIDKALLDYLAAYVDLDNANREHQIAAAKEIYREKKLAIIDYVRGLEDRVRYFEETCRTGE